MVVGCGGRGGVEALPFATVVFCESFPAVIWLTVGRGQQVREEVRSVICSRSCASFWGMLLWAIAIRWGAVVGAHGLRQPTFGTIKSLI